MARSRSLSSLHMSASALAAPSTSVHRCISALLFNLAYELSRRTFLAQIVLSILNFFAM
jgi:hypothetical protein